MYCLILIRDKRRPAAAEAELRRSCSGREGLNLKPTKNGASHRRPGPKLAAAKEATHHRHSAVGQRTLGNTGKLALLPSNRSSSRASTYSQSGVPQSRVFQRSRDDIAKENIVDKRLR